MSYDSNDALKSFIIVTDLTDDILLNFALSVMFIKMGITILS